MILDKIMAYKREELRLKKKALSLTELREQGKDRLSPIDDFAASLRNGGVRLIAEVKRASPSKGTLCRDFDPVDLARTYAAKGAAAVSVLTDKRFFQGELEYLSRIKSAISNSQFAIPILRKDFIFDPYQVYETYAYGADALLLIVAVLTDGMLAELLALTRDLGMVALVEVHDEQEMERALRLRPWVIGINNRNLRDFSSDFSTFERLRPLLPGDVLTVAESGVQTAADVGLLAGMDADAILVGEALVTARDVAAKVRELVAGGSQ